MAGFGFVLDPTSEDAGNAQLDLSDGTNYIVLSDPEPDLSPPDIATQWAASTDTEGSTPAATKHENRRITLTVRAYGGTASGLDSQLAKLQQKAGKITREGGTLKVTVPSSKSVVFDLLDAQIATPLRRRLATNFIAETALSFTAKPYGRGSEVTKSLRSETTLPALIFTETAIGGDVPALGKLEVNEAGGADQWVVLYGMQSRTYDAATTAGLFYEAEALTPQGGATVQALTGGSGASGVKIASAGDGWVSMLSTKLSGGSHLSHVGDYRVFTSAVGSNTGDVYVCLEWSQGDLRAPTRNDEVRLPQSGTGTQPGLQFIDLGTIHLDRMLRGPQQWEGRILARAKFGDDPVAIDYLLFVPVERSGEARAIPPSAAPTSFLARDEFNQTAGALTGKAAATGGTWAGAGDADDFVLNTSQIRVDRTAVSDAVDTPRRMTVPTAAMTDTIGQVDFMLATSTDSAWRGGLILRHDAATGRHIRITAGADGTVKWDYFTNDSMTTNAYRPVAATEVPDLDRNSWYTLRALIDVSGRIFIWLGPKGGALTLRVAFQDAKLAAGGNWSSGVPGFFDLYTSATAATRSFDNFWAAVPSRDAAMFASQSLEFRHDGVIREDAAGNVWSGVSSFEGDYLQIPPAGQEGRSARFVVKALRNPPEVCPNPAIDDISATLKFTPRFLELPE